MSLTLALALCFAPALGASPAGEGRETGTWPQWRGPARDGSAPGPAWPERFGEGRLVREWRVVLGPSYSGPIVAQDRVFTTETVDKSRERVSAFERTSGEELWRAEWEGAMSVPFFARRNGSWIRATPAYDGERLYVAGMLDVLVCLDASDGRELWRCDFAARLRTERPTFGSVSSPLVEGDFVYVQAGEGVCKLDKKSGEILWRALPGPGGMMGGAFSSPVLAELAGERQLVVQARETLAGLDPASGALRWSTPVPSFRGMNILTPALHEGSIFTATYGGRAQLLDLARTEKTCELSQRWSKPQQGYMTSPVIAGGHAYLFLRSNRYSCIRLSDGETTWTSPPTGVEYASLVLQGDRILALANDGTLSLIAADPREFRVLDRADLSEEESWAHLALAGTQLFVREQNALSAWRWR